MPYDCYTTIMMWQWILAIIDLKVNFYYHIIIVECQLYECILNSWNRNSREQNEDLDKVKKNEKLVCGK